MVDDWVIKTMYATKRRRRSVKSSNVKQEMKDPPKSNPSKRHRLRLNGELDHLASLLPFEQSVISRLDRLSILRLGVSYLRTKAYFQALQERYALEGHHQHHHHSHLYAEPSFTDTDSVLQALNGFLFVVSCDGEVFFSSRTVEQYLGFHQSDIIHQSAMELIHSEDREQFKNELNWRSKLSQDQQDMTLQEALLPENSHLLQRQFTVRFRCLLDNTSGFITLEISGHIKVLMGQNLKGDQPEPLLSLFAICCPFGPLPLLDVPPRDYTFKSKHKMDLAPLSMDHRGKLLFGYSDHELQEKGGYDLIHPDDLTYYAAAHQELIKTGSSGLIAYRLMSKDFRWLWLQTSSKVIYKNSKPDFVICTHRHLTDDEGRDLVGKRGSEFKLPYPIIDTDTTGLGSPIDEEMSGTGKSGKSPRNKKNKTQLRDYLQTGRKRKTPYREFNGLNGYNPYTALSGYPAPCPQTGEIKADISAMYPYTGNNYGLDTSDIYRSTGYTYGGLYPSTTDSYRLEAEKHTAAYPNGYYLEPRQYQHTLQYHGNGYTDFMSPTSKYSYDMSKYGYDTHAVASSYGLDLSKRPYEEMDFHKYSHDYSAADKLSSVSRVNGSLDPLKSSTLYGTTPILNNDSLNMASGTPCTLYSSVDRYGQDASRDMKLGKLPSTPQSDSSNDISKQTSAIMPNGHASVIRNASPRTKSPRQEAHPSSTTSMYQSYNSSGVSVLSSCGNPSGNPHGSATWPACSKTPTPQCKQGSPVGTPTGTPHDGSSMSSAQAALPPMSNSDMGSRIISPKHEGSAAVALNSMAAAPQANSSPASATTATSVIQQSGRARSYDKQPTGGIAVPVVKSSTSSASWLHHPLSAPSYDWHGVSSSADSYAPYGKSATSLGAAGMRTDMYGTELSHIQYGRGVIEAPKYAGMKAVGDVKSEAANPLLSFSEVTHTLLNAE